MPYDKRNWPSGKTPISADNLEAMDQGIYQNSTDIEDLKDSTTPEAIKKATGLYPMIDYQGTPTEDTVGKFGQKYWDNIKLKAYLCTQIMNNKYTWNEIVLATLKIAGFNLSADISIEQLQTALEAYPFKIFTSAPTTSDVGKVGQFGGHISYSTIEKIYSVNLYLCCSAGKTEGTYQWVCINNNSVSEEQLAAAIEQYISDHPELGNGSDGKSAYEIACDNGFEGTEEEWLESLHGEDGFSPTIDVSSTDNGYVFTISNVDNFVKNVLVKHGKDGANGIDGKDGKTPVLGVDYFTESDKADIVSAVIDSLGGNPIFGVVDENNNIVVSGNLLNGTYTVKYELEDGTTIDIGELTLTDDDTEEPAYTNLAEPNTDNTTDFTIWCNDSRITTTGEVETSSGKSTTNFFEATKGDTVRYRGLTIYRLGLYKPDKTAIVGGSLNSLNTNGYLAEYNETDEEVSFKIHPTVNLDIGYVRLSGTLTGTADDVIITVNEEIV